MKSYLVLIKGKGALDYSPEELERRLAEYRAWVDTLGERHLGANRLENEGVHILKRGTMTTDGPFLEAKEIIAGYIILQAESLQEAAQLAETCPLLQYFELFVRPMVGG